MYDELATWIDKVLAQGLPEEIVAVCFNIYEDADNSWQLDLLMEI